jgi:hypothetical protein
MIERLAVLHYLHRHARRVRSLQARARIVIRQHLSRLTRGTSIMQRLHQLPLPPALLRFLAMDNEKLLSDEDLIRQFQAYQAKKKQNSR